MAKKLTFKTAKDFYVEVLKLIDATGVPYMVGGAVALREYTGIYRDTKDIDLFCKPSDYTKILRVLIKNGWESEITDPRWLAKAFHNDFLVDLIFSTASGQFTVDDTWFEYAPTIKLYDLEVKCLAPEELILTKALLMDRHRFDGADVNHVLLKQGKTLDWGRLLMRMEPYWEILLAHILMFRFVYPTEIKSIPKKIVKSLLDRVDDQFAMPVPKDKICRGQLLSRTQYEVDIREWGYLSFT